MSTKLEIATETYIRTSAAAIQLQNSTKELSLEESKELLDIANDLLRAANKCRHIIEDLEGKEAFNAIGKFVTKLGAQANG